MPSSEILREAQQLQSVSNRLDVLAEEHTIVSDALITIAGNIRHTAALLEVLVVAKFGTDPMPGLADA